MDLGRYFIGDSISYPIPRKKEWVAAAIGAAVSLGSTLFGAKKSADAEKKAEAKENAAHNANVANYVKRANQKYIDTSAGQATLNSAKEYANDYVKKAQGASAVGGATAEEAAIAKDKANNVVKDVYRAGAQQDTANQNHAEDMLASENTQYAHQQASNLRQRGANIASAASAMGNAVGGAISSLESAKSTGASLSDSQKADINQYYVKNPDEWSQTKKSVLGGTDAAVGTEEYKKNQEKLFGVKM